MNSKRKQDDTSSNEKKRMKMTQNYLSTKVNEYNPHITGQSSSTSSSFRRPHEIGCFSVDKERTFCDNGKSKLKLFHPPAKDKTFKFDLKVGFDSFHNRDKLMGHSTVSPVSINLLLEWIQAKKDVLLQKDSQNLNLYTDFISWRGILTKILCTPYERRDAWITGVTKCNGTFYLCEFETEKKIQEHLNPDSRHEQMSYWGYKFEHYVTCEDNGNCRLEDPLTPINNSECFNSVLRTRLDSHSLIFSAEIDCVDQAKSDRSQEGYIELKTSREFTHPRQENNFKRFKLLKWWAQSFLAGIETIICGFRNDDGIVKRLQTYDVNKLPDLAKEIPGSWKPDVCVNFCNAFLSFIKETVTVDDPKVVYLFRFDPEKAPKITVEKQSSDSEYVFLPDWYIKDMTKSSP